MTLYKMLFSILFWMPVLVMRASPIVSATITQSSGTYTYSYNLSTDDSAQTIVAFTLVGLKGLDPNSVTEPDGWFLTTPIQPGRLFWLAADPAFYATSASDVIGFTFQSGAPPGTGLFGVLFGEADPEGHFSASGTTTSPAGPLVPEPSTAVLAGAALTALTTVAAVYKSRRGWSGWLRAGTPGDSQ